MVGRFEGTIEKIVALAVLMPIVAGMGGNAGTQVFALMVRGLALGQVGALQRADAGVEGIPRRADQRPDAWAWCSASIVLLWYRDFRFPR